VDFDVEPYKIKNDGRIQNFVGEDDLQLPYKLASQVEL
jgi:hypothetical protein